MPHEHANETERGKAGLFAWFSMRPDTGIFIVDAICTRQVHYGMMGEPKGERKRTNRWKMIYIQ